MKETFLMNIKGLQSYSGPDEDTDIVLTTEAGFEKQDGVFFIDYEETEITGMEGTKTLIEIGDNYVSLRRTGTVNTNMLFMKDRKTSSCYNTPYGELLIGIFTNKLEIDVDENGGKVSVDYYIDINNATTSKNNFDLEIRRKN